MRPHVIVHNTVSLDGSIDGFEVDLGLHYGLAAELATQATLVGSGSARKSFELFGPAPEETEADRRPPTGREGKPLWFIPDSGGSLNGRLHAFRRFEECRDCVVLVSERTPAGYLDYLESRGYAHHCLGQDRVDLARGVELVAERYGVERLLVDSGPSLVSALLSRGLVDQLSLIIVPTVTGRSGRRLFDAVEAPVGLQLVQRREEQGCQVLLFDVRGRAEPSLAE